MKTVLSMFFILFFTALGAFALPLENLVTSAQAAQLVTGSRSVIETQLSRPSPRLTPQNSEIRQIVDRTAAAVRPNVMIESLYLYKKPDNYHTPSNSWDSAQKTGVFNQMLAISTLTGIQYYSTSRKAMRVFYEYSRIIEGPTSRNTRPDPVYSHIPASLTLYARQKDGTFGDNIYRYDYVSYIDALIFTQENVTGLSYGIIPAIGKGNLRTVMAFFDCGDSILIYAAFMTNTFSIPGMSDRISSSFTSRAEAVLNWFLGRLNNIVFI